MTKQILISIGILIILLAAGVWVYLLIFGTPEAPDEIFTNLGLGEQPDRTEPITEPSNGQTNLVIEDGLQQLTTRPIAGFVILVSSTTNAVRYAEQGTGHIYEIDLTTAIENRLTQTTFPRTQRAVFSANGQYVALSSVANNSIATYAGEVDTSAREVRGFDLPPNSKNIFMSNVGDVRYTVANNVAGTGFQANIVNSSVEALFTVPLTSFHMLWGTAQGEADFLVTKPAASLKGYLYRVDGSSLLPTPIIGYGLTTERNGDSILFSTTNESGYQASLYNVSSSTGRTVPILVLPEKCDIAERIICAAPLEFSERTLRNNYPERWYQGLMRSEDSLWEIQLTSDESIAEAVFLLDLQAEAGRVIDVTDLEATDGMIFFRNRVDNTLWLYE